MYFQSKSDYISEVYKLDHFLTTLDTESDIKRHKTTYSNLVRLLQKPYNIGTYWSLENKTKKLMVEAAGIEPASKGCDRRNLHAYSVHFDFAFDK